MALTRVSGNLIVSGVTLTSPAITGNLTLSEGTANGVTYLNGSKVLTSGSALVFDGTNLGLGVTPTASSGSYKVFEVGASGNSVRAATSDQDLYVSCNLYYNSGWKFGGNGYGALYDQYHGTHSWLYTANNSSGAGASASSLTQAMTLNASGNFAVGTTSTTARVNIAVAYSSDAATSLGDVSKSHIHLGYPGFNNQYCQITFGYDAVNAAAAIGYVGTNAAGSTNGALVFATRDVTTSTLPTERARIPSTGGIQSVNSISVGNATPASSGAGITFPATQSASTDANTLDDYEEGTYTLSLGGTSTTSINAGIYTKVGRMVHCMGLISVTTLGTGSATTITGGLPFNPSNAGGGNSGGSVSYYSGLAVNVIAISPYLIQGSTALAFTGSAAASTGSSGLAIFGNGARIDYTAVYST